MWRRRWPWLAIGALAFAVRLVYVALWSRHASLGFDGRSYYELGKRLADDHAYESVLDARRGSTVLFPPGFPFVIALFRLLGATTRTRVLFALAGLGTATVIVVGLVARRIAGERAGLLAALIAAVYPNLFLAEGALMSEALIALLIAVAMLLLLRARDRATTGAFAIAGVPLGWMGITRSDGWLVAVVMVGVTVATVRGLTRANRVRLAAAGLAATIVVVGAWEVRNAVRVHAFVPVAVNSWSVIAGANCHEAYYGDRVGSWYVECLDFGAAIRAHEHGEVAVNRSMASRGIDYAKHHAGRLPVVLAARLGLTFGAYQPLHEVDVEAFFEGRSRPWAKVGYFVYLALALAAIAGVVALRRRREGQLAAILAAPLIVVVLSTLAGYGNQRFRMAFEPSLVVLAAIGVLALAQRRLAPREQG